MAQSNSLDIFQYTSLAVILDYFSELELRFSDYITKDLLYKAIQEELFPSFFTRYVLDMLLTKSPEGRMTFASFSSYYIALRHFYFYADGDFISKDKFKEFIESNKVPGRLKDYVTHTYVPTLEEIAKASSMVQNFPQDSSYFGSYNNLIFLQKSKKS